MQKYLENIDRTFGNEICIEGIPSTLAINSNIEKRKLSYVKNAFRRNKFDHKNFDSFMNSNLELYL